MPLDIAKQAALENAVRQASETLKPRGWFPALVTYEDGKVWLEFYWEPPEPKPPQQTT